MKAAPSTQITQLLRKWSEGDRAALDRLLPLVYDKLHRQAARLMRRQVPGHTLQTTGLVHEAYLRLGKSRLVELRYFGGLSLEEAAAALGVSLVTVKREWTTVRAWLKRELTAGADGGLRRE